MGKEIGRRKALALLGAGVMAANLKAAQHHMHTLETSPADYHLQFFTPEEDTLLDRVSEMIVPADEHSGGAHAALVHQYIDLVVANSSTATQAEWRAQLKAFQDLAISNLGKPFAELDAGRQSELMNSLADRASAASLPAELFFVQMRRITLAGYYTSRIGLIDDLGYQGNRVLPAFPGCPHGSHGHAGSAMRRS